MLHSSITQIYQTHAQRLLSLCVSAKRFSVRSMFKALNQIYSHKKILTFYQHLPIKLASLFKMHSNLNRHVKPWMKPNLSQSSLFKLVGSNSRKTEALLVFTIRVQGRLSFTEKMARRKKKQPGTRIQQEPELEARFFLFRF